MSATSRPRAAFRRSDSCGLSIAGVVRLAVCTGCAGSCMSIAYTPTPSAALAAASLGNNSVLSK